LDYLSSSAAQIFRFFMPRTACALGHISQSAGQILCDTIPISADGLIVTGSGAGFTISSGAHVIELSSAHATSPLSFSGSGTEITIILTGSNDVSGGDAVAIACAAGADLTFTSSLGGSLTATSSLGVIASSPGATCKSIRFVNGTYDLDATGTGSCIGSPGSSSTLTTLSIEGGTFDLTSEQGATIGTGSSSGTTQVSNLRISGGDITCTTATVAIGAVGSGGKVGNTLTVAGGDITATCGSGPAIGSNAYGVTSIAITGGNYDLTVTASSGHVIGAVPSGTGQTMTVTVADSTFVASGHTFIGGTATEKWISGLTFQGDVRVTFTRPGVSTDSVNYVTDKPNWGGGNGGGAVYFAADASLSAVTPEKFFNKGVTINTGVNMAIMYTYGNAQEDASAWPKITFSSNLFSAGQVIDMNLKWGSETHTIVVAPSIIGKILMTGTTSGSYSVTYYLHQTGETGSLCAQNSVCSWTAGTGTVNIDLTQRSSKMNNPTKSPTPLPSTPSPAQTINVATEDFTSVDLPYHRRRRFRRITSIVIVLCT
jgi:hypothetical protein